MIHNLLCGQGKIAGRLGKSRLLSSLKQPYLNLNLGTLNAIIDPVSVIGIC